MASDVTALSQLATGESSTVDQPLNFVTFDPGVRYELRDTNATRGTFFKDGNRVRQSRNVVTPRGSFEPSMAEWVYFAKWIMGGSPTGSGTITYPWSNTALTKYVYFKPIAGDPYYLSGVAVDTAVIKASAGEPLTLDLECVGQTADTSPSSYPSLTIDQTTQPLMMSDLSLSFGGSTRQCREFSIRISNNIDRTRFLNSLTLTRVQKLNAQFVLTIDVPSGDNASLWDDGIAGAVLTATFTNPTSGSTAVMVISSPDVRFPAQSPTYPPNAEGFLRIEGECYRTSGTANPLTITLTQ